MIRPRRSASRPRQARSRWAWLAAVAAASVAGSLAAKRAALLRDHAESTPSGTEATGPAGRVNAASRALAATAATRLRLAGTDARRRARAAVRAAWREILRADHGVPNDPDGDRASPPAAGSTPVITPEPDGQLTPALRHGASGAGDAAPAGTPSSIARSTPAGNE
ncbi:MAG TPA: hypothetical protein VGS19_38910 [Streptosporangiaceae bacterium]|nr:hypothetical protein [Streptosporangiaceae bacterium]